MTRFQPEVMVFNSLLFPGERATDAVEEGVKREKQSADPQMVKPP